MTRDEETALLTQESISIYDLKERVAIFLTFLNSLWGIFSALLCLLTTYSWEEFPKNIVPFRAIFFILALLNLLPIFFVLLKGFTHKILILASFFSMINFTLYVVGFCGLKIFELNPPPRVMVTFSLQLVGMPISWLTFFYAVSQISKF